MMTPPLWALADSGYYGCRNKVIMDGDKVEILCGDDALEYAVRVSVRAKRLQLKVTAWGQVEVVVPRHVSISHAVPFLLQHRQWIQHTLATQRALRDAQPALSSLTPDRIHLEGLAEEWQVSYARGQRTRVYAAIEGDGRRMLRVEIAAAAAAYEPLQRWIHDYARLRLIPWLQAVSEECRRPYSRATVRAQKTRWGSCTAAGHINLNRHLLFLPPRLVKYLFIHELCHTVHLNHSRRYWALVSRYAPDFAACEAELRGAARCIPLWACAQ